MMHLKNISAGNPKTMAQFQLTKRSGVIWLYSEDGKNRYAQQKNFAEDTLKIAYDQTGVIVNISKDVSTI
ncbi:tail fiber assembly protein, partial [Salmonella enterica subsp. enterica serovar London]|nr:tail fiber assembly protein [Salmonella enterica subsp. enterica serovar London]